MYSFISVIHCLICLFLVLVILLQQGRGGGLSAFSGGAQQIFGGQGAGNILTRATAISAGLVLVTCIFLARMSTSRDKALEVAVGPSTPTKTETPVKKLDSKPSTPPAAAKPSNSAK